MSTVVRCQDPVRVFYSYSHKDTLFREKLVTQLTILRDRGYIREWYDRKMLPGDPLDKVIREELRKADLILLLISPAFLASTYINEVELKEALSRNQEGSARVIPIILQSCDWKRPGLRDLLALPTDGKPVATWKPRDEAYQIIADGIRGVVEYLRSAFRVLVVEDHSGWRDKLRERIPLALAVGDGEALQIEVVTTYPEGERALMRRRWDLLVTDICLPPDNREVLGRQLVRLARSMGVPCIVVSGTVWVTKTLVRDLLMDNDYRARDYLDKDELQRDPRRWQQFYEAARIIMNEWRGATDLTR